MRKKTNLTERLDYSPDELFVKFRRPLMTGKTSVSSMLLDLRFEQRYLHRKVCQLTEHHGVVNRVPQNGWG